MLISLILVFDALLIIVGLWYEISCIAWHHLKIFAVKTFNKQMLYKLRWNFKQLLSNSCLYCTSYYISKLLSMNTILEVSVISETRVLFEIYYFQNKCKLLNNRWNPIPYLIITNLKRRKKSQSFPFQQTELSKVANNIKKYYDS